MKVVQINACSNGSTGKIMFSIHKELLARNYDSYVVWGNGMNSNDSKEIYMGNKLEIFIHKVYSHIFCKQGFASLHATKKLLKKLDEIKPDIVHLHNLHGNYINIELLFKYLKENSIKTIWTFHDTWAFTGKCVYFSIANCYKWKDECKKCPIIHDSPKSYIDKSNWCFKKKKELFSNLNLTIVSPSNWLASLAKMSFMKDYPVEVINNGVNTDIFKNRKSEFRKEYNIEDKKIILGVASPWSRRKGLNDFIKLSKVLDNNYIIVLIGVNDKQIQQLPHNIIGIKRTENQIKLAEIYSTSDILFNPTYEDTYPTVNIEAIACNTPVLTYDTGGSSEFIKFLKNNENNYILEKDKVNKNFNIVKKYIDNIINDTETFKVIDRNALNVATMVDKYIRLYENIS